MSVWKMRCLIRTILVSKCMKYKINLSPYKIINYSTKSESIQNHTNKTFRESVLKGPSLNDFINKISIKTDEKINISQNVIPYLNIDKKLGLNRTVYFDIHGCQMNVNDTEIIWSILKKQGFRKINILEDADIVLVITCAIREGAELKIWNKLEYLKGLKNTRMKNKYRTKMKIGILGCMAERLKDQILEKEKAVDLVAGPDSYKDLPRMLALTENDQTAVNVLLSLDETYADIMPVHLNEDSVTAFVSIMRGCDNMCSYCIVPFTRGRERSRPINSIIDEIKMLSDRGIKEITLLGQNVNSYRDLTDKHSNTSTTHLAKGFKTVYKTKTGGMRFVDLLDKVSAVNSEMRIRFTSPHPKDFPNEVIQLIKDRLNICRSIHLPAQSGSSDVLQRMRRGYTREAYLELVSQIRTILPNVALSSDFICGFCNETEEEFEETLSLIREVKYNMAYLFPYSMREKTTAYRRYIDDVSPEVKKQRLIRMIDTYRHEILQLNFSQIGQQQLVLVEGRSKRSEKFLAGRNELNTKIIFPHCEIPVKGLNNLCRGIKPGDYVVVQINAASSQVLKGIPLFHTSLKQYALID